MDTFVYPVNLNFNEKGKRHKTCFGRIMTILYYIFIFGYSILCLCKLIYHLQDVENLVTSSLNLASVGIINYNETGFKIFSSIKGKMIDRSLDNLQRFLDIYYVESTFNFSVSQVKDE